MDKEASLKFTCVTCGKEHELNEISFGADRPLQWDGLSEDERKASRLDKELCLIHTAKGHDFFVNACLEIPVMGTSKVFTWGVWVSLSEKSFKEVLDHWRDPKRKALGPYFGWLCTRIPEYPNTFLLKTMVHNREVGLRPTVELEPTEHPLAVHQRQGIPADELERLVHKLLHPER